MQRFCINQNALRKKKIVRVTKVIKQRINYSVNCYTFHIIEMWERWNFIMKKKFLATFLAFAMTVGMVFAGSGTTAMAAES